MKPLTHQYLEETYMIDFIVNVFAEIADFLISFCVDKIIDRFAKRKRESNGRTI